MEQARHRFEVLDAARGIAAVTIVVYHGAGWSLPLAYAAVDLFFLLSGFVLAHRHGRELTAGSGRGRFMAKRLIRLYPLYAAGTMLGALVTYRMIGIGLEGWNGQWFALSMLLSTFFVPTPTPSWLGMFPLDGPAWSLFFELVANLVFAWCGWRWRPVLVILIVTAPLLLWSMKVVEGGDGFSLQDFISGFPRVLFSFFLGVALYRLWRGERIVRPAVPAAGFLASLPLLYAFGTSMETKYYALLVFAIQPAIVWIAASSTIRLYGRRAMLWLGTISYGVYVLHVPIQLGFELVARPAAGVSWEDSPPAYVVLMTLPTALLLAHLLTYHFDGPARRWLTARLPASHARARSGA
jgi:peptidoglycan/LPS O-acetylase OafA/YrhL